MSSYKKYLVLFILGVLFASCQVEEQGFIEEKKEVKEFVKVEAKAFDLEDYYIVYALEMENAGMYNDAQSLYFKLFENTNKYEYLINHINILVQFKEYERALSTIKKYFIEGIKEEELLLRFEAFSLFKLEHLQEALNKALNLVSLYPNPDTYELLATIYLEQNDYENAKLAFEKVLEYQFSASVVQIKTNLEFFKLDMKSKAIKELEKYLLKSEYDFNLALQLITFYSNLNEDENIKKVLKNMFLYYIKNNDISNKDRTISLMLQNFKSEELISYLEKSHLEDELLLDLYQREEKFQKAYDLLQKMYEKYQNTEYLAQQAIFEFELAKDKKKVLVSVIEKFNLALEDSTNHIYQNYLAYLLIDYDLDIQKGLELVEKALEQEPDNMAYLDTLAWGEYKIKDCKKAYENMKKVVDTIGLEDEEVSFHWKKIQECLE